MDKIEEAIGSVFNGEAVKAVHSFIYTLMFKNNIAITDVRILSNDKRGKYAPYMICLDVIVSKPKHRQIEVIIEGKGDVADYDPLISNGAGNEVALSASPTEREIMAAIDHVLAENPKTSTIGFESVKEIGANVIVDLPSDFEWDKAGQLEDDLITMLLFNKVIPGFFSDLKIDTKKKSSFLVLSFRFLSEGDVFERTYPYSEGDVFRRTYPYYETKARDTQAAVKQIIYRAVQQPYSINSAEINIVSEEYQNPHLRGVVAEFNTYLEEKITKNVGHIFEDPRYPNSFRWVVMCSQDYDDGKWFVGEYLYPTKEEAEQRLRSHFRAAGFLATIKEGMPDSGEFTRVLLTEKPRNKSMVDQFAEIGEKIIQDSSHGLQEMIHPMVIAAEDKWRLDIQAGIIAAQRLMGKAKYRKVVIDPQHCLFEN